MRKSIKRYLGFGLIEILVTLGVLSVGIVGVTVLHSTVTRQSAENKSRAEALAIAQSRIEEMRNYTGDVDTLAEFNAEFPNTTDFGTSTPVYGTNAEFSRQEHVTASGDMKNVAVRVSWTDSDNLTQTVTLNTRLSYVPPRSIGDTALEAATSIVNAPTGRARLGDGTLPDDLTLDDLTSNDDRTYTYTENNERFLVTEDEEIVLTLEEACQTEDGTCIDFVRIKGRVYIDRTSQSSLTPGEVFVIASDAAYCARYYTDANGEVQRVTRNTTATITTGNGTTGSYTYFDYTCYIGGGWHGNIGILLAGGLGNADKICIGDPVTSNAWAMPIIAARRVYRGMLYKPQPDSGTEIQTEDGAVEVEPVEGSTLPRFYSQGIADSVELPVPDSGEKTHDFVVGSFQQNLTDGSNCETQGVMTRADATVDGTIGGLFEGVPTDFVCLNDGLLDNFDDGEYANTVTCPYDPSDPPSSALKISGSISLEAESNSTNAVIAATIGALTSDGPGNCTTTATGHNGTHYNYTYICDVYVWRNDDGVTLNPWSGYIEAGYDASKMECDPYRLPKSGVSAASTGNDFTTCTTGSYAVIRGTVSAGGNRKLSAVSMGSDGACTIASTGLSYECRSTAFLEDSRNFTLTFTPNSGVVCKAAPPHTGASAVYTFPNLAPGNHTQNLTIANNANGC